MSFVPPEADLQEYDASALGALKAQDDVSDEGLHTSAAASCGGTTSANTARIDATQTLIEMLSRLAARRAPPLRALRFSCNLHFRRDEEERQFAPAGVRGLSGSAAGISAAKALGSISILSPAETQAVAAVVGKAAPLVGPLAVKFLSVAPALWCQIFWLSPLPTVRQFIADKSTGGLPPLGYFSMMANGWLWVCYGYTADMNLTIMLPNATGFVAGAYYTKQFLDHDSGKFDTQKLKIGSAAIMAGCVVAAAGLPAETAQPLLGWVGVGVVIAMFSGPLTVIKEVHRAPLSL